MKPLIIIDGRLANLRHAGLGRYSLNFLRFLPEVADRQFRYGVLARPEDISHLGKLTRGFYSFYPLAASHYSWQEQWQVPFLLRRLQPNLVHFLHFNVPLFLPVPFVVTIHDLIKHHSFGKAATTRSFLSYRLKRWGYRLVFRQAVCRAKAIITPSWWTAQDLRRHYQCVQKVKVIPEGVDPDILSRRKTGRLPDGVQKSFLLYVGSLYPHKNATLLLKMLQEWPAAPQLVVVAARSVFRDRFWQEAQKMGVAKKVLLVGFVEDNVLAEFYRQALALVFPSRLEGFGLPGLEAMARGCPVIAARAGALPETLGPAALYFNPDSLSELRHQVEIILNERRRQKYCRLGLRWVKRYSWQKMAQGIMDLYQEVL